MAIYKDVDALLKLNKGLLEHAEMNGMYNHARIYERFVNSIEETPTADVVPRAEVEEIFAEIDKRIASLEYRANTPRKTVKVEELKAQCDWILHEVIPKTLAEFKKKYIGDKR